MVSAIILAAGGSVRMGGVNKQLALIGGVPVFVMSALKFQRCAAVDEIIIAAPEDRVKIYEELAASYGISKLKAVTKGGSTRFQSVKNALAAVSEEAGFIAVHDGARPLIETEDIARVIANAREHGGASIIAVHAPDTVKAAKNGIIRDTIPRGGLYYAQTPQVFKKDLYLNCLRRIGLSAENVTDDSEILEICGRPVHITEIRSCNMKITYPEDIIAANAVHNSRQPAKRRARTGQGYDVHRLCEGRRLVLCGVEIPYEKGLLGHSDADAAVHAVMDAVLGAMAKGDIGQLFPDNDAAYKDADSMELLSRVIRLMRDGGYSLGNLDLTIIAEKPRLAPYIPRMRENLARAFGTGTDRVSVKATTEEGLGLAGEGIGALACVLLE